MEKVIINGKEYSIDIEKCKKQGLLIEAKDYPKDWGDLVVKIKGDCIKSVCAKMCMSNEERLAYIALGKLIQLRNWWWDNMCGEWRPNYSDGGTPKYSIHYYANKIVREAYFYNSNILSFPTEPICNKFLDTYRDLIEEAKIFL